MNFDDQSDIVTTKCIPLNQANRQEKIGADHGPGGRRNPRFWSARGPSQKITDRRRAACRRAGHDRRGAADRTPRRAGQAADRPRCRDAAPLVNQGMGDNTLRALTSDLAYLEAWGLAGHRKVPALAGARRLLLKFVAHHLWDPERRETDPDHGMRPPRRKTSGAKGFSNPSVRTRQRRCAGGWRTGRR